MACSYARFAYQCFGVGDSLPSSNTLAVPLLASGCVASYGQLDRRGIRQQAGGDSFRVSGFLDHRPAGVVSCSRYSSQSPPHPGSHERACGQAFLQGSGSADRVVSVPSCVQASHSSVGLFTCGSVCHSVECEVSDLCAFDSGPSGVVGVCPVDLMGRFVRVLVPSCQGHRQGAAEGQVTRLPIDPGCALSSSAPFCYTCWWTFHVLFWIGGIY